MSKKPIPPTVINVPLLPALSSMVVSEPQAKFLRSQSKLKLMNCGRFGGKTMFAMLEALWWALYLFALRIQDANWWRPGPLVTVGIFAPTEKNLKSAWNTLLSIIPQIPGMAADGLANTTVFRADMQICLFGYLGIQMDIISCWSADNIRGAGYDIIVVDEAAQLSRPSIFHKQILPLCRRAGYFGKVTLCSTPLNNFWDRWVDGALRKKGLFRDYHVSQWTPFDNPKLSREQYDQIAGDRDEDPGNFDQEYMAKLFVQLAVERANEGENVFQPSQIASVLVTDEMRLTGPFVVGFDLAWLGPDEAALAVIDKPTNVLCHLEFHPKTNNQDLLTILDRVDRQWNQPDITFDRTGGRARAWADILPPKYHLHPLVFRRSIDRNRNADYIVSKDLLVRGVAQRMAVDLLRIPDPDQYPLETLPWSNQQDQRANLKKLLLQMHAFHVRTIKKADGTEEYLYFPGEYFNPETGRSEVHDDGFDALLLASRKLEAITTPHIPLEEVESALLANW